MPEPLLRAGLVSITFRKLPAAEVLKEAVDAGLDGIEWGGDVHVPHGDLVAAERVGQATRDAGMEVPTYGSYWRAGAGPGASEQPSIEQVVRSAAALGAAAVRVWAGEAGSADADLGMRARVAAALREACDRAADAGRGVTLESHAGTLTDTADSTLELLGAVDRPNLSTLWQTTNGADAAHSLDNLRRLNEHVLHAHAFHWGPGGFQEKKPLAEGAADWAAYLDELRAGAEAEAGAARGGARPRFCLLEFVRGGSVEAFREDAAVLKRWLTERG